MFDGNLTDYLSASLPFLAGEQLRLEAAIRARIIGDGSQITIKPNGDGKTGLLNWKHDDASGYITHFTSGANSGAGAFLMALGTDEGSAGGLLISAKNPNAAGLQIAHNPGASIGAYIISYDNDPALHIDTYVGSGGVKLQAKTGAGFGDGVAVLGSTTFTSATAAFTAGDVGQSITQLTNVGSVSPTGCIPAGTTIAAFVDANTVTLSQAATASGTGVRFRVAGRAVSATQNYLRLIDTDGSTILGAIQHDLFDWRTPMSIANNLPGSVGFKVTGAASQSADIFDVFVNGNGTAAIKVASTGKFTGSFAALFSNAGQTGQPALQVGNNSSTLQLLLLKNNISSPGNMLELQNSSATVLARVSPLGYYYHKLLAAPADSDVAASEVALWFDSTAGAAKLMIKGKNASGTVVTGSVALA
jgi:hypothetical protein